MPRRNDTRICDEFDMECWYSVSERLYNVDLSTQCLPACNSLTYDTTVTTYKRNYKSKNPDHRFVNIEIGFDNQQYLFQRRSEFYGIISFLAGCAGILSLFTGASFLSIGEILYYVTLRPFLERRKRQAATENIGQSSKCKQTLTITSPSAIKLNYAFTTQSTTKRTSIVNGSSSFKTPIISGPSATKRTSDIIRTSSTSILTS